MRDAIDAPVEVDTPSAGKSYCAGSSSLFGLFGLDAYNRIPKATEATDANFTGVRHALASSPQNANSAMPTTNSICTPLDKVKATAPAPANNA